MCFAMVRRYIKVGAEWGTTIGSSRIKRFFAAIEGKAKGIRVNAILPGAIETPMLRENPNVKSGAERLDANSIGQPEDIADAIAFLVSDDAKFVQGAALRADGGRLSRL